MRVQYLHHTGNKRLPPAGLLPASPHNVSSIAFRRLPELFFRVYLRFERTGKLAITATATAILLILITYCSFLKISIATDSSSASLLGLPE